MPVDPNDFVYGEGDRFAQQAYEYTVQKDIADREKLIAERDTVLRESMERVKVNAQQQDTNAAFAAQSLRDLVSRVENPPPFDWKKYAPLALIAGALYFVFFRR
jgi:hypothetical protein